MGRLALVALCACGSPIDPAAPAWREVTAAGPAARWGHAAVYDAARDRMLVYAGASEHGDLGDLWAFDLASETWTQLAAVAPEPPPRINPGVVLDSLRDRLVIFGGRTGLTGTLDDVWAFELATATWHSLAAGPPARQRPHAASDGARAWFYGGEGTLARVFGDLWELDFASDTWRELPGDRGRTCGAFAYADGALVVIGGHDVVAVDDDLRRYDITRAEWSTLAARGSTAAGAHWAFDLDRATGRVWLAGGDHLDNYDTSLTDALALDAMAFSRVPTANLPPVHDHATLVVDPVRGNVVLFGGTVGDGQTFLGDTWILPASP